MDFAMSTFDNASVLSHDGKSNTISNSGSGFTKQQRSVTDPLPPDDHHHSLQPSCKSSRTDYFDHPNKAMSLRSDPLLSLSPADANNMLSFSSSSSAIAAKDANQTSSLFSFYQPSPAILHHTQLPAPFSFCIFQFLLLHHHHHLYSLQPSTMETHNLPRSTYHIFLRFRGADTRKSFTDHLYTAFCNAGFHTFRDDEEIQKGHRILPELQKAIQQSSVSVIVFSKHYASSKWCLNELLNILRRRRIDDRYRVFPVFYDVQPSDVGNQRGTFEEAFDDFEKSGGVSMELIGEWREALKEVSKLTGKVLQDESNGHEAVFIQTIVKEVGIILKRTVLAVTPYTVGIEYQVKDIDFWLKDPDDVSIGVISGMRGIGKTTIAKLSEFKMQYPKKEFYLLLMMWIR